MKTLWALGLLVSMTTAVHADVVDGGQAIFGGTLTVQGANGLTSSSAALTATGSGVYSLTASSGIHIINGKLKLEQGGFIEWADTTKSTTASSGGGTVANSTITTFTGASSTFDIGAFGTVAKVSTLTLTMSGGTRADINFRCPMLATLGVMYIGVLLDGAFFDGQTSTKGLTAYAYNAGSMPVMLRHITNDTLSAGSHSFAMVFYEDGGGVGQVNAADQSCEFAVSEFR